MPSAHTKINKVCTTTEIVDICLEKIKKSYDVLVEVDDIPEHTRISDNCKGFYGIGVTTKALLQSGVTLDYFCKAVESKLIERISLLKKSDESFKRRNLSIEICVEKDLDTFTDNLHFTKLPGIQVNIWIFGYLEKRLVIE